MQHNKNRAFEILFSIFSESAYRLMNSLLSIKYTKIIKNK